ncbi:MAG: acyltransferase family protein [Firmicutes bacterium]|nr:acyltransferase family protein [Bacillota bacterium]
MKRQYAAVDIAKWVSALLVVCIHTFPFLEISETLNLLWIATVCRLAVPFFFVSSAFFLFKKFEDGEEDHNKEVLFDYCMRILKLYGIWTVIYLPYTIWDHMATGFSLTGIVSYFRDLFLNGSYYHLWFLPALVVAAIIVWYLTEHFDLSRSLKIAFGLYVFGYFMNVYSPIWQAVPGISFFYGFFIKVFGTARNGFFFGPIYMMIGYLLARTKRLPEKVSLIGFGASFVLLVLEVLLYNAFGVLQDLSSMFLCLIPCSYFLMNYLLKVRIPQPQKYVHWRLESSLIYTSHILFAKVLLRVLPSAHFVVYFLTLCFAQLFAVLVVRYKDRFPILKNLM